MEKVRKVSHLSCISYNCSHAGSAKLPLLKELFEECDFLLLQEHGLHKCQFDWFDNIYDRIGKHGVSAMDETQLLRGRPHGGVVILWNPDLKCKIVPVKCESKKLCALIVELGGEKLLLVNVYMPCDDRCLDQNINEYVQALNDIEILCNSVSVNYICIGGDFNTDLSRSDIQTRSLNAFIIRNDFNYCAQDMCCNIEYTFCSRGTGATSFIDHFIVSENLLGKLISFDPIESINNFSDHLPVKCNFEIETLYSVYETKKSFPKRCPAWDKATAIDKEKYKEIVEKKLEGIVIPHDAISCNDVFCTEHLNQINAFHNDIADVLVCASAECIPSSSTRFEKAVPGWNNYVEKFFRSALLWHFLWKENGQPKNGLLAELRRKTRSQYHQAYKMVLRHEGELRLDKIETTFNQGADINAWCSIRHFNSRSTNLPPAIDDVAGAKNIANLFANKFKDLFNIVSYDDAEIKTLKNSINTKIVDRCLGHSCSQCGNHKITPADVKNAINKLKNNKKDGNVELMSNHIIEAGDRLNVYLSLLLTAMIAHGNSPDGMMWSTLAPTPKGKWKDSGSSANYRAIALSSIFGKILDVIVMEKEEKQLLTSNMQFGFKKGASTSLCTCMVQETISYFVSKNTNVYGLLLDATKAFDRINFVKLFNVLLARNICPLICRLLLFMYTRQKLRIRWNGEFSDGFSVSNGVKQGGVISPILFCVYIDELLVKLENSGVGCYMGRAFSGAFAYADDITLLCPSISALKEMIAICTKYAVEYDIKFNASKSQLIIFRGRSGKIVHPEIQMNGDKIEVVSSVVHLGHILHDNIYKYDINKCVSDFNRQSNIFLAKFKYASSHLRNFLFHKYCTSFYGTQILPMYEACFGELYKAWRMAVRRVWRVPWRTHCNLLPHMAGVMAPELWFVKRAINFANLAINSKNPYVKTVSNMGLFGSYSTFGGNVRWLQYKYSLDVKQIHKQWNEACKDELHMSLIRQVAQIKELCQMRDRYNNELLTREEISQIIEYLCTS